MHSCDDFLLNWITFWRNNWVASKLESLETPVKKNHEISRIHHIFASCSIHIKAFTPNTTSIKSDPLDSYITDQLQKALLSRILPLKWRNLVTYSKDKPSLVLKFLEHLRQNCREESDFQLIINQASSWSTLIKARPAVLASCQPCNSICPGNDWYQSICSAFATAGIQPKTSVWHQSISMG